MAGREDEVSRRSRRLSRPIVRTACRRGCRAPSPAFHARVMGFTGRRMAPGNLAMASGNPPSGHGSPLSAFELRKLARGKRRDRAPRAGDGFRTAIHRSRTAIDGIALAIDGVPPLRSWLAECQPNGHRSAIDGMFLPGHGVPDAIDQARACRPWLSAGGASLSAPDHRRRDQASRDRRYGLNSCSSQGFCASTRLTPTRSSAGSVASRASSASNSRATSSSR